MNEDQDQNGPAEEIPYPTEPETENIPRKETITVKISADCMCFVADCPLHSEAPEMFLGLRRAHDAAERARLAIDKVSGTTPGIDEAYARVQEVIAALELPLSRLSERVVLR